MYSSKLTINTKSIVDKLLVLYYIIPISVLGNGSNYVYHIKILMLLVLGIYVVFLKRRVINFYSRWLILYLVYTVLSINWSAHNIYTTENLMSIFYAVACALSIIAILNYNTDKRNLLLFALILVPFFKYVIFILENGTNYMFNLRYDPLDQTYNSIGQTALYAFIYLSILMDNNKNNYKNKGILYKILIILSVFLMAISGSRKIFLNLTIFIAGLIVFKSKNSFKMLLRLCFVCLILYVVYKLTMRGTFGEGMENLLKSILQNEYDGSVTGRLNQNEIDLILIKKKPIFGYGIGYIEYYCRVVLAQLRPITDNDYLSLAVDLGIVGVIIFYGMHFYLLIKYIICYKHWTHEDICLFLLLIIFIFNGAILRTFTKNYMVYIHLFIIWLNIHKRTKINNVEYSKGS